MPVIDKATFEELEQMSGEDFINELIDAFLEEGPHMLYNLQAALQAGDVELLPQERPFPQDQRQHLWRHGAGRDGKGIGIYGPGKQPGCGGSDSIN